MSKKLSRRRKVRRARAAPKTFTITVEAQPIVVRYKPNSFGEMANFEYRSPYRPARRIPFGEKGYFSCYASMSRVRAAKSPQEFARDELLGLMRYRMKRYSRDNVELPLF
jgi:hypothetical protein